MVPRILHQHKKSNMPYGNHKSNLSFRHMTSSSKFSELMRFFTSRMTQRLLYEDCSRPKQLCILYLYGNTLRFGNLCAKPRCDALAESRCQLSVACNALRLAERWSVSYCRLPTKTTRCQARRLDSCRLTSPTIPVSVNCARNHDSEL
jgi:hypothetical protein